MTVDKVLKNLEKKRERFERKLELCKRKRKEPSFATLIRSLRTIKKKASDPYKTATGILFDPEAALMEAAKLLGRQVVCLGNVQGVSVIDGINPTIALIENRLRIKSLQQLQGYELE